MPDERSRDEHFDAFVHRHYDKLVKAASHTVGPDAANDVVHDVLIKLYAKKQVDWSSNPIGYVYTATTNKGLDHFKTSWWRRSVLSGSSQDLDEQTSRFQKRDGPRGDLTEALSELDPRIRNVLVCRYELGLSAEEIATAMHYSVGTVNSWIRKGREQLAQKLDLPAEETS